MLAKKRSNVIKLEGQIQLEDYTVHVVGINLSQAWVQDKVEMMEETQKVLTTNLLKVTHHLEKRETELMNLKTTVELLRMKEKEKDIEITWLTQELEKKTLSLSQ